jgi:hypothetical protein
MMSSDLETRISLEVFQRHLLVTHLKDEAAGVLDQLERRASQSGESFSTLLAECVKSRFPKEAHFQEDCWYAEEIPIDGCYFAHPDFRKHPVPKDERFVDFMPTKREEIESGSFPYSSKIRAPWSETPMPQPLVSERKLGKYYILDGQLRVIRHWYHQVPNVKVFVYRGKLNV